MLLEPITHYEFESQRFLREPGWRFLRAVEITKEENSQFPDIDDRLTQRLAALLKMRSKLVDQAHQGVESTLHRHFGALYLALQLNLIPKYRALREEVEARILARQTKAVISTLTGLSSQVIDMYEQTFFQVRDRLEAVDYIMLQVIDGPAVERSSAERLVKQIAYTCGAESLDVLLVVRHARSEIASALKNSLQRRLARNPRLESALVKSPAARGIREFLDQVLEIQLVQNDVVGMGDSAFQIQEDRTKTSASRRLAG